MLAGLVYFGELVSTIRARSRHWAGCSGFLNDPFKSLCITHVTWDFVGLGAAGG